MIICYVTLTHTKSCTSVQTIPATTSCLR